MSKRAYISWKTGDVFGRWTIVAKAALRWGTQAYWLCQCSCGTQREVSAQRLRAGRSRSCGCYDRSQTGRKTHGLKKIPEYKIWVAMTQRCHNPSDRSYANYGGRGITVCQRWRNSFTHFLTDIGRRPSPKHSLDRINNSGNYDPANCRWATSIEQQTNKRTTRLLTHNGKTMCLRYWAHEIGVPETTLRMRLAKGVPFSQIVEGA